jgi:hypothetical protein
VGTYGWNVFNELLDCVLILELRATTVWTRTELDLNVLIDLLGLVPEGARMSALAPRPLRGHGALLWLDTERSSLTVRGALGCFEGGLQLGDAFCLDFELLVQRSVLDSQGLGFGRQLRQALGLRQRGLE